MNLKKLILIIGTLLISNYSFSQAQIENGDQKLQAGFRFFGYESGISLSYDYGLFSLVSLGAGADFYFQGDDNFFIYGRSNLHLGNLLGMDSKFDLYPGVDVGLTANGLGFAARLGCRYFFSNAIGLYAEIGNHGSLGVSINL